MLSWGTGRGSWERKARTKASLPQDTAPPKSHGGGGGLTCCACLSSLSLSRTHPSWRMSPQQGSARCPYQAQSVGTGVLCRARRMGDCASLYRERPCSVLPKATSPFSLVGLPSPGMGPAWTVRVGEPHATLVLTAASRGWEGRGGWQGVSGGSGRGGSPTRDDGLRTWPC